MVRKYDSVQMLRQLANFVVDDGDTPEARALWNVIDVLHNTATEVDWDTLYDAVAKGLTEDQVFEFGDDK